jgi:putative addiction module killer protein
MPTLSPHAKSFFTAGISGLRWAEANISPHRYLIEKERAYVSETVKESFNGLLALALKANQAIAAFEDLQSVMSEGRRYFIPGDVYGEGNKDPNFDLRQLAYHQGRKLGFEKGERHLTKNIHQVNAVVEHHFSKEEIQEAVRAAARIEGRRVSAAHSFSGLLEESVRMMTKDVAVLHAVCLLGRVDDADRFARDRREDVRLSRKNLFEWLNGARDSYEAFCAEFVMEGWLRSVARIGGMLEGASHADFQPSEPLGNLIPDDRKRALSAALVKLLDEIAVHARVYTAFPESPGKDLLRIEFFLGELEKPLPALLREEHTRQLGVVTARFLDHPQHLLYLVAVSEDAEHHRLLDHLVRAQGDRERASVSDITEVTPCPHESRTLIRREIRQSQQNERTERELSELMGSIAEARDASVSERAPAVKSVRYFPTRIEQELATFAADLPEHVQASLFTLIERCAAGEKVDSKAINIEKKIFELRLVGSGYRIYCTRSSKNELVVLGFGSKESQRTDIVTAHGRYRNFVAANET